MPSKDAGASRRRRAVAMVACCLLGAGCSHLGSRGVRPEPGAGSSTLGSDFKEAPRGKVIPPAGFGVDLVGSPESERGDLELASASRVESPSRPSP